MLDVELQIKNRSSLKVEELIDKDTDIPSEDHANCPIKIEEAEEAN